MTARRRQAAILWVGLFVASSAFPIVAGLVNANSLPSWLGPLDVLLAAITALLGFFLLSAAGRPISESNTTLAYRVIQACAVAFLILILVFFVAPTAVKWTVLAIGLAWRAWLLVTVLPGVITHLNDR